jgi:Family of unknown function (DUF5762)
MSVFWADDPNVLFQTTQWFPSSSLTLEEKLNALSRSLLVLTVALLVCCRKKKTIIVMFICTFLMIYAIYDCRKTEKFSNKEKELGSKAEQNVCGLLPKEKEKEKEEEKEKEKEKEAEREMSKDMDTDLNMDKDAVSFGSYSSLDANRIQTRHYKEEEYIASRAAFHRPSAANPFSNPILSESDTRLAPPLALQTVQLDIGRQSKKAVVNANAQISRALFAKKTDKLEFEQSMRSFYSVPRDEGHILQHSNIDMSGKKGGSLLFAA